MAYGVGEDSKFNPFSTYYRMDDNREIISATECQRLLSECHEIMCSSCDLVHTRCVKVLNIRSKAGLLDDLASSEFVSLVRLTENFMSHSVHITGRRCPSLRTALLSQVYIKSLLIAFLP